MEAMASDCHGERQRNPKRVVHRPPGSHDVGHTHLPLCQGRGREMWTASPLPSIGSKLWLVPISVFVCWCMPWGVQIACISLPLVDSLPHSAHSGSPGRPVTLVKCGNPLLTPGRARGLRTCLAPPVKRTNKCISRVLQKCSMWRKSRFRARDLEIRIQQGRFPPYGFVWESGLPFLKLTGWFALFFLVFPFFVFQDRQRNVWKSTSDPR